MARHIPFVNTQDDCHLLKKYYADSDIIRVSLDKIKSIKAQLPRSIPLWVDAGVDGCDHHLKKVDNPLPEYIKRFRGHEVLASRSAITRPEPSRLKVLVTDVLDRCCQHKPGWITVPQLPLVQDASRNKINSALAKAAYEWKLAAQFKGKLVLPLIFTHQKQVARRTEWRPRVDSALKRYNKAGADSIWVVDSDLSDQMGTGTFRTRFAALVDLHTYIRENLPQGTEVVAGPYWGMNLVLWARGLCDHPAIGLGSAYAYYIPGGHLHRGKPRIALPPLRRCAVVGPLKDWLEDSRERLNPKTQAFAELSELRDKYDSLLIPDAAKDQTAKFYKSWFDGIAQTPMAGRSLALYQDLSSAYVLGKQLPTLPRAGNAARRPERVAEYYMLNCL
jgi:hypothetical protein